MNSPVWDYAVKNVADILRCDGQGAAVDKSKLWEKNMGMDAEKLLAASRLAEAERKAR